MTDARDARASAAAAASASNDIGTLPSLDDVRAAYARIADGVVRTPLLRLHLPANPDAVVYAKPENLQRTGSFKLRGALNFLARLDPEVRGRGVVAHSSGNHAQGVAYAARHFGVPATIVIPDGAAAVKVAGTLALGADVRRCENTQASRVETAMAIAREQGSTLVPPFDHPWIVEGQGTVGLEIVEDLPGVANVIVPIGGGGLSAGIGLAIKASRPEAKVLGVEPELAADARESLERGERVTWPPERVTMTIADGVRTQSIGALNFALLRRDMSGVVTVTEEEIRDATAWYANVAHLVVEPTGALSLAALRVLLGPGRLHGLPALQDGPTVVVISGGNIDPDALCRLLQPRA